ncbi:MAG: AraC family transcriptional regulator [Pseudomonadota bacterium]
MNRSFIQSALLLALLATTATAYPADAPVAPTPVAAAAAETPAATAAPATAEPTTDAAAPVAAPDTRALDEEIQGIKKDVVDLNRDLFVLEEELLFPANTQVAVFLSMDVGAFFALDTVELRVDDKQVSKYLYTPREAEALLKGGVQRLYLGNLRVGGHELVALFTGKGPNGQDYSRGAQLKFEKSVGAKYLELKISDKQHKQQPEFEIKDWE